MTGKTYRIGEAAQMLNLKTYVLRFWETEFPELRPMRTEKGQRLYTEQHVELLKRIRHLLHERGMTIEGAKRRLSEMETAGSGVAPQGTPADLTLRSPPSSRPSRRNFWRYAVCSRLTATGRNRPFISTFFSYPP